MAGLVSYRQADKDNLYAINVEGTRHVMEAALNAKRTPRIIHLASIAGMGIAPEGTIGDESLEYNLQGHKLFYCDTKREGEQIVLDMARQKGLPAISLNPGITFGEGDTHPHHHTIFASMAKGILLGYPVGGVMFSDIRDIVDTSINAMTRGRFGERYVVGSANMTFRDASVVLSQVIGSRPPQFPIPAVVSEIAGSACEAVFPLFGRRPALTRAVAWLSQRKIFFSSDKAISELGHRQTPFEETVRRTAPYYLQSAGKHVVHSF
jgi:dihydroflavonol-4-reductase